MKIARKNIIDTLHAIGKSTNFVNSVRIYLDGGVIFSADSVSVRDGKVYAGRKSGPTFGVIRPDHIIAIEVQINDAECRKYGIEPTLDAVLKHLSQRRRAAPQAGAF